MKDIFGLVDNPDLGYAQKFKTSVRLTSRDWSCV